MSGRSEDLGTQSAAVPNKRLVPATCPNVCLEATGPHLDLGRLGVSAAQHAPRSLLARRARRCRRRGLEATRLVARATSHSRSSRSGRRWRLRLRQQSRARRGQCSAQALARPRFDTPCSRSCLPHPRSRRQRLISCSGSDAEPRNSCCSNLIRQRRISSARTRNSRATLAVLPSVSSTRGTASRLDSSLYSAPGPFREYVQAHYRNLLTVHAIDATHRPHRKPKGGS